MASRRKAARKAEKRANKKAERAATREAARQRRAERSAQGNFFERGFYTMISEYDFGVIILVTALVLFGIVMVFSAGYYTTTNSADPDPYYFLKRQSFFAVLGTAAMIIFARTKRFDYHFFGRHYIAAMAVSLAMLALLIPFGVSVNGAVRWLPFPVFRITPSEISKIAMIIFTSAFLAQKPERVRKFWKGLFPLFFVMGAHAVLIVWQPNLSTAIVVCAIMIGIMFVAGMHVGYIGAMFGVLGAGCFIILNFFQNTHWYTRLTSWTDPFADAQGDGYQVSQSLIALGNGGLKGLGLGNSISKTLYLPEPQNDFILAIIGEELGFIGILVLLVVYLILIQRCLVIAANAADRLGSLMASGIGIMLALQVIINVAVTTASMPATGITLPFISYGGTSIIVFMAAMGLLLNISRKRESVQ